MESIDERMENILKKISISEDRFDYVKNIAGKVFSLLNNIGGSFTNYAFGGSFDRYTAIRNHFDLDLYLVVNSYAFPFQQYSGESMLRMLYDLMLRLHNQDGPFKIARKPPYVHAIPAIYNDDVELDCLIAVDVPYNQHCYYIPEGPNVKIARPAVDEEIIRIFNRNTYGIGTKIIRLMKLWNYIHYKPLKSFQIELLTSKVFEDKSINSLSKGIVTAFNYGIQILRDNVLLYRQEVHQGLNRDNAIAAFQDAVNSIKNEEWSNIFPNYW
jgi:hypothetical protein